MQENPGQNGHISEKLGGSRVIVLGPDSAVKETFFRELEELKSLCNIEFEISESAEKMKPEDYVILFGMTDTKEPVTNDAKTDSAHPWKRAEKGKGEYVRPWMDFGALTDHLKRIAQSKPQAAVFVSDSSVYGKMFGDLHLVKEDEAGYVCHTDDADQDAQRMRMAEHICSRMARENGAAIKIARVQKAKERISPAGAENRNKKNVRTEMAEAIITVLLDGAAGEPYNVPGISEVSLAAGVTSPLSPNFVVADLGKTARL